MKRIFLNIRRPSPLSYTFVFMGALLMSCKCSPAERADERTPTTSVECYDQAFAVVRECRAVGTFPRLAGMQACLTLLDDALNLCDRHYGQPYHNGKRHENRGDDTDIATATDTATGPSL